MSSQKKLSLLKRLKVFLKLDDKNQSTDGSASTTSDMQPTTPQATYADSQPVSKNFHSHPDPNLDDSKTVATLSKSKKDALSNTTADADTYRQDKDSFNIDNMEKHNTINRNTAQRSERPITDAVMKVLDSNELSYRYHPSCRADNRNRRTHSDNSTESEGVSSTDSTSQKVHYISMSMKYYTDTNNDAQHRDRHSIEWGCIIRVHEHTQLIAMYGALPFHLPDSHLNAGLTLATQINYDLILGNVEIDVKDGEIRFKNAVDLEPIIAMNNGVIPPDIINYLLKSVIAMTSSIAPLFIELINSDPEDFELQTVLNQLHEVSDADNNTYVVVTDTIQ